MSDYISRDSVINTVLELAKEPSIQKSPDTVNGLLGAYNILYEFPSADVRENIHGEWIKIGQGYVCSRCSTTCAVTEMADAWIYHTNDRFCRGCGADMRRGE